MESGNREPEGTQQPNCGGDEAQPSCCESPATEQPAGACGPGSACCGTPAKRSPWKTLLGVLIVLAALAVGLYSVFASPGTAPAPVAPQGNPPTAATAPAPQVPAAGGSCCGGAQAPAAAPAAPACCGGGNQAAAAPTCGGGNQAAAAPTCGGAGGGTGGSCCGGN